MFRSPSYVLSLFFQSGRYLKSDISNLQVYNLIYSETSLGIRLCPETQHFFLIMLRTLPWFLKVTKSKFIANRPTGSLVSVGQKKQTNKFGELLYIDDLPLL